MHSTDAAASDAAASSSSSDASSSSSSSSDAYLSSVLDDFPPTCAAFAYGSAVFSQSGYSADQRAQAMLDLVLVVDEPEAWHAANLVANAAHYSPVGRLLGARRVAHVQEDIGAAMYYNHASVRGRLVKYGVISRRALVDDLSR